MDGLSNSFALPYLISVEVQKNADIIVVNGTTKMRLTNLSLKLGATSSSTDENTATILCQYVAYNKTMRHDLDAKPKLVQTDSELTIYVPTARTDADALLMQRTTVSRQEALKKSSSMRQIVMWLRTTLLKQPSMAVPALAAQNMSIKGSIHEDHCHSNQSNPCKADKAAQAQGISTRTKRVAKIFGRFKLCG